MRARKNFLPCRPRSATVPPSHMEKTLVLLKPDCTAKRLCGDVISRFEHAGFQILGCKMLAMSSGLLREHYAHIVNEPFFPRLERFMLGAPVVVLVLAGQGVVAKGRQMIGPTDSAKAPRGTIRGDFGLDSMANIIHASETVPAAEEEINRFFKPEEIFSY